MRNRRLVTFKIIAHNSAGIEWKSPVLTARYRFHTFNAKKGTWDKNELIGRREQMR